MGAWNGGVGWGGPYDGVSGDWGRERNRGVCGMGYGGGTGWGGLFMEWGWDWGVIGAGGGVPWNWGGWEWGRGMG